MNYEKGSEGEGLVNSKAIRLMIEAIQACPNVVKPAMSIEEFADQLMAGAKKLVDNNYVSAKY